MTVVFLLTTIRAAYVLWHYVPVAKENVVLEVFVQGIRFDLALVGVLLLLPVIVGSLLAMFGFLRATVKHALTAWLFVSLAVLLLLELVSLWFMTTVGMRPDAATLASINGPLIVQVLKDHPAPALIGGSLYVLILIAFWRRLEVSRLMVYRVGPLGALCLSALGGALCVVAIWSGPVNTQPPLGLDDARLSEDERVNELALNSGYKLLYAAVEDYLPHHLWADDQAPD